MGRVLYVIPNVCPLFGGAHIATANLIRRLRLEGFDVDVLTNCEVDDDVRIKFGCAKFFKWEPPPRYGLAWFISRCISRIKRAYDYPVWSTDPDGSIRRLMMQYDCVCVMSEEDPLRRVVSKLPRQIRKVQMIHTWYSRWCSLSRYTRWMTRCDKSVYAGMDAVAVVGDANAIEFREMFPGIADKVHAFKNIIDIVPTVRCCNLSLERRVRILTLARFDESSKMSSRTLRIARRLIAEGYDIEWVFAGNGYEKIAEKVQSEGLSDVIRFLGHIEDVGTLLAISDIMALFSRFEGLPMSVYEAFLAGVPVAGTAVGGMRSQIVDGVNGWLFRDDEESILSGMRRVLSNKTVIEAAKRNLFCYKYDNEDVLKKHKSILGL